MKIKKVLIVFLDVIALLFMFLDIFNIISNKYLFCICMISIFVLTSYIIKMSKIRK